MTTSTKPPVDRRTTPRETARNRTPQPPRPEIPDSLIAALRERLATRRVGDGIRLFEEHAAVLDRLDPAQANAACLVGAVAEWVDIGFDRPARVQEMLSRFGREVR